MVAKETEAWGGEEVGGIVGLVTSKKIKLGSFFAFGLMVPVHQRLREVRSIEGFRNREFR